MPSLSHLKLFIPRHDTIEVPPELAQKWQANYYAQIRRISGQRRRAIRTVKDFNKKIAQPLIKATTRYASPTFHSRSGSTTEDILAKQRKKLEKFAARRYMKNLDKAYRTVDGVKAKKILHRIEAGAVNYSWGMRRSWALQGQRSEESPGVISLALRWLTGDETALNVLHKNDELLNGAPMVVPETKRIKQFKNQLNRRLTQAGVNILMHIPEDPRYPLESCLARENLKTNQLIQELAQDKWTGFSSNGASHVDFLVKDLPDPKDTTRIIKQVYLDIRVSKR